MGRFIPPSITGSWGRRSCSHPSLALPRRALVRSHALPQGFAHPTSTPPFLQRQISTPPSNTHTRWQTQNLETSPAREAPFLLLPSMAELPDSLDSPTRLPFFEFLLNLLHQAFKAFTPPKLLLPRSRAFCWVQRVVSLS